MEVTEIEEEQGEFCVTKLRNNFIKDNEMGVVGGGMLAFEGTETKRQHIVVPDKKHCTCDIWQNTKKPCCHGVAYFWKWREYPLETILRDHAHYYYCYKSLHGLYKHNACPVSSNTLQFDNETLPPPNLKRKAGRPKKTALLSAKQVH